jgi:hypothetical protein
VISSAPSARKTRRRFVRELLFAIRREERKRRGDRRVAAHVFRLDPLVRVEVRVAGALEGFKSGRYPVLVATDIAARGIDVDALGHVIS